MVGSLVDHRAYKPYTLVGPPVFRPLLAPLAVYSSTTDYVYYCYKDRFYLNWSEKTLNLDIISCFINWIKVLS